MMFRDRKDAGEQLGEALAQYRNQRPLVVALPRGGVPVGYEVARALGAPLEVFVVRKLGAPFQPELGVGALAEDGTVWVSPSATRLGIDEDALAAVASEEQAEAERRVKRYRGGRPFPDVRGRTVILVDDGIATGGTARVAARALRAREPARLVLAVPVASPDTVEDLRPEVDAVVCLSMPEDLWAIGRWYRDFHQLSDEDVLDSLARAKGPPGEAAPPRSAESTAAAPASPPSSPATVASEPSAPRTFVPHRR